MMRTPPPGCGAMEHPGTMKTGTRANRILGAEFKLTWPLMSTPLVIGMMSLKVVKKVSSVIIEVIFICLCDLYSLYIFSFLSV